MVSAVGLIAALGRVWGAMVGVALLIAGAGAAYQQVQTMRDTEAFPPPGQVVDVGGFRLHIVCTGDAGGGRPTVIMDGFLGTLYWRPLVPEVANATRVCSYDRAGRAGASLGRCRGPASAW